HSSMTYALLAARATVGAAALALIALAALHILKPEIPPSRTMISQYALGRHGWEKPPNPRGPERFLGFPNRLFMVAYRVWLMVVAPQTVCLVMVDCGFPWHGTFT